MVGLLDQLDILSLPPMSFPPDLAFLRSHLLHMLYSVGKGRLLLLRCLMRLPQPHTFDVVSILASNLPATCTPASPSRVDEQFAVLAADVLYAAPMHLANIAYSQFLHLSAHTQLVTAVKSKMGCMFLQVLAKKGQDMRAAYNTTQQRQLQETAGEADTVQHRPAPSPTLSDSTVTFPRLSSVSADFAVWSYLTSELLRLLSGQWAAVFSDLPKLANHAPATHTANSSSSAAQPSLASARAMWDLLSLLLSHITAVTSHTPTDDEAEQASQQLASLIAELTPLLHRYLTLTYQLDGSRTEELKQSAPAAVTAAAVVAASTSIPSSPPRLLPPLHASLLYACSVLLSPDDPTLSAAQSAHRESEEAVRAFIAAKQARLSLQYSNRQQAQHHTAPTAPASLRGQSTRGGSHYHATHNGYPQQRRGPASQSQSQPSKQSTAAIGQHSATTKSQPGSYAFAASGKV